MNTTKQRSICHAILTAVQSSQIYAIGYSQDARILTVQFPKREGGQIVGGGSVYQYENVEQAKFDAFLADKSKGKFFGEFIKERADEHPFTKLEAGEVADYITLQQADQQEAA